MHRLSSNWTLFFKIFLPTFWITFFGVLTLAVFFVKTPAFSGITAMVFKMGTLAFFAVGTAVLYFTLIQLKRVDIDPEHLYVSNYFKTFRYPFSNIERIGERNLGLFHLVRLHLKAPGRFGSRITFLLDDSMLSAFFEKHPEAATQFRLRNG